MEASARGSLGIISSTSRAVASGLSVGIARIDVGLTSGVGEGGVAAGLTTVILVLTTVVASWAAASILVLLLSALIVVTTFPRSAATAVVATVREASRGGATTS